MYQTNTYVPRERPESAAELYKLLSEAAFDRRIVVPHSVRDGRLFRSPRFEARGSVNSFHLTSVAGELDFSQMLKRRNNANRLQPDLLRGVVSLSNVGVSLALTLSVASQKYAVLAYRGGEAIGRRNSLL